MRWERIAIPALVLVGVAALWMSRSRSPGVTPGRQDRMAPVSGMRPGAPAGRSEAAPPARPPAPAREVPSFQEAVRRSDPAQRALSWLTTAQGADGRWPGKLRVTGLVLVAFLNCHQTHRHGEFQKTVRNALKLLKQVQGPDGAFAPLNQADNIPDHAIATLAMCEAFSLTASPLFKASAQMAVDAAAKLYDEEECQKAYGISSTEIDPASAVWLALAVSSAKLAGLRVPEELLSACRIRLFAPCGDPRFPPATAAALWAGRLIAGLRLEVDPEKHPEMMDALVSCRSGPPSGGGAPDGACWFFGLSAACLANDDDAWAQWCEVFDRRVLTRQREDGSFGAEGPQGVGLGEAGTTAFHLASLARRLASPGTFRRTR